MTITELISRLEATGYSVAENNFKTEDRPAPPFITYTTTGHRALYADGVVYWYSGQLKIELIVKAKDPTAEAKLTTALSGLTYTWTEAVDNGQAVYIYTIITEV